MRYILAGCLHATRKQGTAPHSCCRCRTCRLRFHSLRQRPAPRSDLEVGAAVGLTRAESKPNPALGAMPRCQSASKSKRVKLILSPTPIMTRLRKSKQLADLSVPTPTSPAELIRNLTSQRNPRALAVSSAAIALSIGSPSCDTPDISSDGATVQGRSTGWQTAYSAARMAVEITKESSDMFLPLKAVAAAISVLIKNYDVNMPCRN